MFELRGLAQLSSLSGPASGRPIPAEVVQNLGFLTGFVTVRATPYDGGRPSAVGVGAGALQNKAGVWGGGSPSGEGEHKHE